MPAFIESVNARLGRELEMGDRDEDVETPTYELHADDDGEEHRHAPVDEDLVTPEVDDDYVNSQVVLPQGDCMTTGVVKR